MDQGMGTNVKDAPPAATGVPTDFVEMILRETAQDLTAVFDGVGAGYRIYKRIRAVFQGASTNRAAATPRGMVTMARKGA
jgi:hypothetical protein